MSWKGSVSTATPVTLAPGMKSRVPSSNPAVVPPEPVAETTWPSRIPAARAWTVNSRTQLA